jgi:hypothetical protein
MAKTRRVEIFSAGCGVCEEAIALVKGLTCLACEGIVLPMSEPAVAARARALGVRSPPAIAVDGRLAGCCAGRGVDTAALQAAGVAQSAL